MSPSFLQPPESPVELAKNELSNITPIYSKLYNLLQVRPFMVKFV